MLLTFSKYHGAGNDFIIIDGRKQAPLTTQQISFLCDRHFGIGADGLIIISVSSEADYEMKYFNADGNIGSMCGNGARCAFRYASENNFIQTNHSRFVAYDGIHSAENISDKEIRVSMMDVSDIKKIGEKTFDLNTGSPHFVQFLSGIDSIDMNDFGKKIRYNNEYREKGINVNVAEVISENQLKMRTYERGVEAETLACGTGTVAVALCYDFMNENKNSKSEISINAPGGNLKVYFEREINSHSYKNIFLQGEAAHVFDGSIELK